MDKDSLQLVGDGLLAALAQGVDGAKELATQCIGALRERGWVDEVERWCAFSEDRQRGRARSWLAARGYRPSSPQKTPG
jgi:hypothetical protein